MLPVDTQQLIMLWLQIDFFADSKMTKFLFIELL